MQYYYRLHPPTHFPHDFLQMDIEVYRQCKSYNQNNLPLRTHLNYQRDGQANNLNNAGVKGVSPLYTDNIDPDIMSI